MTTSTNPAVEAILSGKAPQQAMLAAASGLLPLPQADLLEVLVALRASENQEIANAAAATLNEQESRDLLDAAKATDTSPAVLAYLGESEAAREIREAVILNARTPDDAIVQMAASVSDGSLLELITLNQQRLVRSPTIIDAILKNSARTADAERRAERSN